MITEKTPEEQAKELLRTYMIILDHIIVTRKVKECAAQTVKLAIEITGSKYWYEVLNEIDKATIKFKTDEDIPR
jgi:hypothetical protein